MLKSLELDLDAAVAIRLEKHNCGVISMLGTVVSCAENCTHAATVKQFIAFLCHLMSSQDHTDVIASAKFLRRLRRKRNYFFITSVFILFVMRLPLAGLRIGDRV